MSRAGSVKLMSFELRRALTSRRWLVAGLVWLLVAKLGSESIQTVTYGVHGSVWGVLDVHAVAINSVFNVGLLLLPAFAFVACDSVGRDRETRFIHLVLPRAGDRGAWWTAKVTAIVASAVVFQVGLLVACVGVGWFDGGQLSLEPSTMARYELVTRQPAQMLFAPVQKTQSMLNRELSRASYLALAFAAVGCACMLASIGSTSTWLPAGLCLLGVMIDWTAGYLLPGWFRHIGLVGRMLEGIHSPAMSTPPLSWLSSIAVFLILGGSAVLTGLVLVNRVDI